MHGEITSQVEHRVGILIEDKIKHVVTLSSIPREGEYVQIPATKMCRRVNRVLHMSYYLHGEDRLDALVSVDQYYFLIR